MKPSTNLYYRVKDLHFDNVAIFLIKWHELYLTNEDLNNMRKLSKMYCEMIDNVLRLRHVNFLMLKLPRFDYADQKKNSNERVDLATACAIHYGLHTGMVNTVCITEWLDGHLASSRSQVETLLE